MAVPESRREAVKTLDLSIKLRLTKVRIISKLISRLDFDYLNPPLVIKHQGIQYKSWSESLKNLTGLKPPLQISLDLKQWRVDFLRVDRYRCCIE
jgi:hypothetical protein